MLDSLDKLFNKYYSKLESKDAEISKLTEQLKSADEVFNRNSAFPLVDVLDFLARGCRILLHKKDYDGQDYEEMESSLRELDLILRAIDNYNKLI